MIKRIFSRSVSAPEPRPTTGAVPVVIRVTREQYDAIVADSSRPRESETALAEFAREQRLATP